MKKIIQCVPNFSEGRDLEKVEEIVKVLKRRKGFKLVSYEPDADYNRTVVTLIGEPEPIMNAIVNLMGQTTKLIDMNNHKGEHSRMGALDVVPFIPIQNVTMEECVEYANQTAQKCNKKWHVPIFMYAEAKNKKDREKLPTIRKGEFEGMKDKIKEENWAPDYGKPEIHPTAGATAFGARIPLLAYNIDLDTDDTKVASAIARAIRFSTGGFRFVQAGPIMLEDRGHTQVSMNILNYQKTAVYRVFETVVMEAKRYGVKVTGSEIVGLFPLEALAQSLEYYRGVKKKHSDHYDLKTVAKDIKKYLKLRDFNAKKIIEAHIK